MEHHLRCNNHTSSGICRAVLKQEAIVTTCAHVFCTQCAEKTGLTKAPLGQRHCPTCKSGLPNDYDVARNLLNPSDDYRSSVLAGLDPATTIECAQKALTFWSYQNGQEHAYQQYMTQNLTRRCHQLKAEAEKIVLEANARIEAFETQIQELIAERQSKEQQFADLHQMYQEKSWKQQQTQKLYDVLKQKVQIEQMGVVASNDVDHTLQSVQSAPQNERQHNEPGSRQYLRAPESRSVAEPMQSRYAPVQVGPELLHSHQRSGSSVAGSDQLRMPPPERSRLSRIPHIVPSNTPLTRVALPAQARLSTNRSQIPTTTTRGHLPTSQALPGSSRRLHVPSGRPGSGHNYSAISSGMRVGTSGGSVDLGQGYTRMAAPSRLAHPAHQSFG